MTSTRSSDRNSAVVDNNIICDLYKLGRLDLLFKVFDEVCFSKYMFETEVPEVILKELENYDFELAVLSDENGYVTYSKLVNEKKYKNLSTQDKLVISIAKQYSYYCNSNDGLVRKACVEYEIKCIGILGALELAFKKEILTRNELIEICNNLKSDKTSCFIKLKLINEFMNNIKKL